MSGRITTRHLLTHGRTIVREYGLRTYLRCLYRCARLQPTTFLECVFCG